MIFGLTKAKFLLIILIFSITGNLLQLIQIKNVKNTLLACQLDHQKLVSVIEVNKRTNDLQAQQIAQLQRLVKIQNASVDKQIKTVLTMPETNCVEAIHQGLQELHK